MHNIMVIPLEEGGTNDERDTEDNIIIIDSTLRNILSPQINNTTARYKVVCGCEYCISAKSMHSSFFTRSDRNLKHLRDRSHNAQNIRSGELSSCLFETFKMI